MPRCVSSDDPVWMKWGGRGGASNCERKEISVVASSFLRLCSNLAPKEEVKSVFKAKGKARNDFFLFTACAIVSGHTRRCARSSHKRLNGAPESDNECLTQPQILFHFHSAASLCPHRSGRMSHWTIFSLAPKISISSRGGKQKKNEDEKLPSRVLWKYICSH